MPIIQNVHYQQKRNSKKFKLKPEKRANNQKQRKGASTSRPVPQLKSKKCKNKKERKGQYLASCTPTSLTSVIKTMDSQILTV